MKSEDGKNSLALKSKIYREQLITVEDLEAFKRELLLEIRRLLQELSGQAVKKWLKSSEVRKLLGISSGTLQNLRINGTLPFTKIGGIAYYSYDDIAKLLDHTNNKNF
jgi:hypothetical protein